MAEDGSIVINTKIDASGVNVGTKKIGKDVEKNVAKPMQNLSKALGDVVKTVAKIGIVLAATISVAAIAIGKSLVGMARNVLSEFDILGSAVGEKFKPLTDAINTLKGSLVNLLVQAFIPLIPYLVSFAQWLTE